MQEIILNERVAAIDAIENRVVGKSPARTLMRIAKYYYAEGYKQGDIRQLLRQFMLRCNPEVRLGKWEDVIEYCVRNAGKRPLVEIESVSVTQSEMDTIKAISGGTAQRVMFTLLCLAKLGNAISTKNNNWVNREHSEIFTLANASNLDQKRRCGMLHRMWQYKLIDFSKIVDNINIRVMIIDNDSPVVLNIVDFRNLGNQYRMYRGEKYMQCECCGLVVKRTANACKYCKSCGERRHREWNLNNKINTCEK